MFPMGRRIKIINFITFKNVTKSYFVKGTTVTAVDNINLDVLKGDIISIVGYSGCGKTTLLHLIGKLEQPDNGGIQFLEKAQRTGFVFQQHRLLRAKTIEKNLMLALKHLPCSGSKSQLLNEILSILNLNEFRHAYPHQLSGGMAQRVSLGRALCRQPDLLLMDEPFSALDALIRRNMQEELVRIYLKKKMTTVFVTHDVSEAVYLGRKILIMDMGQIVRKVNVPFPYPRNISSPEFIKIRDSILNTIYTANSTLCS